MKKKLSYLSIEPHLKTLRFSGVYPLGRDTPKLYRAVHRIYMHIALFIIPVHVVQQSIKIYQVRDDLNKVVETMMVLLTNTCAICKHFTIWVKVDKIEELIKIMEGPIFNQNILEHEVVLNQTVRYSKIFLRIFNLCALMTSLFWVITPTILYIKGNPVDVMIWLPFDMNKTLFFYPTMFYIWFQTSYLAINNTTMDALISFFLAQSKIQLTILRMDLENFVRQSKEESELSSQPYSVVLCKRLYKLMLHYNKIVRFSENVENIFSAALLYQFLVSGWIICTIAYRTVDINPVSVDFASMILYMSCIIAELFLFCHFGNEVNWESECVLDSAYMLDWLELPVKARKDLVIFMERLKRPLIPKAGSYVTLSNNTFVSILRSSYSFYVLLKKSN